MLPGRGVSRDQKRVEAEQVRSAMCPVLRVSETSCLFIPASFPLSASGGEGGSQDWPAVTEPQHLVQGRTSGSFTGSP